MWVLHVYFSFTCGSHVNHILTINVSLLFQSRLELKEHPEMGVYVKDLTMIPVHDVKDCEKVMGMGNKNRSVWL
jgi:hypothetical protein